MDKEPAFRCSRIRASAVIATIIAVGIILALLGMLIRILIQPLHVMTRAMEDIADGEGDLTKRLTIVNNDEFGVLGTAFNRFVERIHGSIREVSSATGQVNEVALRVVAASNSSMYNSDQQASRTSSVAAAINQLGAPHGNCSCRTGLEQPATTADSRRRPESVDSSIKAMNQLSSMLSESAATSSDDSKK